MESKPSERWWDDDDFQDSLCALLVNDPATLRACASVLSPEDFKPMRGSLHGVPRQIVAERALDHYKKHHEPLGPLLRADVMEYAASFMGAGKIQSVQDYVVLIAKLKPKSPDAIIGKVVRYKSQILKARGVQEMVDLVSSGMLTDEKWHEITSKTLISVNGHNDTSNYLSTFATRAERRQHEANGGNRTPWTFIDPLDSMVRCVGPRQTGLVIAPYKRGKSMFLEWITVALALQRHNVLHITAEDTLNTVEDRLDSILTRIPMKQLHEFPKHARQRFDMRRAALSQIEVYDATAEALTNARIEEIIQRKRDAGFIPHAIVMDYDEKIQPVRRQEQKRFEIDDVYQEFLRTVARHDCVGWLAAQTHRDTSNLKIIAGDKVAEDIGKIRKVTCALSLGKGDWEGDSIYLYVAAHKTDMMGVGVHIVPDRVRGLVYDRDATDRARKAHADD